MRLTDYTRPFAGIVKPGIAQVLTALGDMAVRRRARTRSLTQSRPGFPIQRYVEQEKPESDADRVLGTKFIVLARIRRYFFRPSLAAAATFDKMGATLCFKKFHDLGSRHFRRDERALRRETSKRLHPGELLLGFRPGGQLHFSVDHPWFIAQDRHLRGHRRP